MYLFENILQDGDFKTHLELQAEDALMRSHNRVHFTHPLLDICVKFSSCTSTVYTRE